MKRKMKAINFALAVIMTLTLLPGCSGSKTSGTSDKQSATSTEKKQELAPYEIIVAIPGTEQKDIQVVQDKISAITKEKINATVKFTTISYASWVQQTNLMLAANEKLDLLWTSSFYNYNAYVAKGQIIALDSLIEKFGKDINNKLGSDILAGAKIKGSLYAIPSVRDFAGNYGLILRKDLASKYKINLDNIKTINDITPALKTIKENEPNMISIATTQSQTPVELFGQGIYDKMENWMGVLALDDSNMKLVNFYETKWYADTLNIMRDWYNAGYFSKDAATNKDAMANLVKADKLFSYGYAGKPGIDTQESRKSGKEMAYVALTPQISTTTNITGMMTSIAKSSKDPERAMMLLNLWFSDKNLVNAFDNGIEGTHFVKKSNNLISFPEGVNGGNTKYTPCNYLIGDNFLSDIWDGDDPQLWTKLDKFNKEAKKSKALGFTFDSEPVKTEVAAVTNVISQYRMGLETGTLDPKEKLPEYISKLKAAGMDKIIAEKQKQLDDWVKTKK